MYLFSFPQGFSYLALYGTYCAIFHLMLWFFNHSEIVAYESGAISALRPRYDWGGTLSLSSDGGSFGSTLPIAANTAAVQESLVSGEVNGAVGVYQSNSGGVEVSAQRESVNQLPAQVVGGGIGAPSSLQESEAPDTDRHLTLGQVEYFSTDSTFVDEFESPVLSADVRGRSLTSNPRSFSTPLDEIIAFEQAIYIRQKYSKSRKGVGVGGRVKPSSGSSVSLESLASSSAAGDTFESNYHERLVSDESYSDAGLSDYGNFVYGGTGDESGVTIGATEGLNAAALKQAELELSRQIQRQQMAAEMGFDLPRPSVPLIPVSTIGRTQDIQSSERILSTEGVASEGITHREGSRRHSLAMFFSNLFSSKQPISQPPPQQSRDDFDESQSSVVSTPPMRPIDPEPVANPARLTTPSTSETFSGLSIFNMMKSPPTSPTHATRARRKKSNDSSESSSSANSSVHKIGNGQGESILEVNHASSNERPDVSSVPSDLHTMYEATSSENISSVFRNTSTETQITAQVARNRPRSHSNSSFGEMGYISSVSAGCPRARSESGVSSRDSSDGSIMSSRSLPTPSEADYIEEERRDRGFSIFGMNLDEEDEDLSDEG